MDETGIVRFPGNLDPRAQEFRPRYPNHFNHHHQLPLFPPPPPQIYYPYTPTAGLGVGYHQFPSPPSPAYVSTSHSGHEPVSLPPPPSSLSHPSATPSRTLLLSSVPTEVSETTVRRELEVFGDVRAVQMERLLYDGLVTVHFYDLRHAQLALTEIRDQHMQQQCRLRNHYYNHNHNNNSFMFAAAAACNNSVVYGGVENLAAAAASVIPLPPPARGLISGQAVWAQFIVPTTSGIPDGHNQGTIVVFNLDSNVSTSSLKAIFEAFGSVKELRETPLKRHQKFVEFYDIRDAAKALVEMNGKEIHGNHVVIEFSRPGGQSRRFFSSNSTTTTTTPSTSNYQRPLPPPPPHKMCGGRSSSTNNVPPRSYLCQPPPQSTKKSKGNNNSAGGNCKSSKTSCGGGVIEAAMASLCLTDGSVENGIEERIIPNGASRKNHAKKSNNNSSTISAATAATMPIKQHSIARNRSSNKGRFKNFDSRFSINGDAILESNRRDSRTTVMIKNIPNKYSQKLILNMLDNHCIHCNDQIADDDDQPVSSYDFLYLPIDFNNKCNVGYGFVNMTTPEATWRLYKAFHQQSWEVFNSRKICEVTYARVQGLEALKEHFKNSKFPSVTEEIFPVVFSPPRDGRHLSNPLPIFGHPILPPAAIITESSFDHHYEMDGSDWPAEEDDGGCSSGHIIIAEEEEEEEANNHELLDGGGHRLESGEADDDDDDDTCNNNNNNDDEEEDDMGYYCGRRSRSRSGGDYGDNDGNSSSWQ